MDPITKALFDYGIAGVFLAYLIWSKHRDQSRSESIRKSYEDKFERVSKENHNEQERIRDRYREVVDKYDLQIKNYSEERQMQINTYAAEREQSRIKEQDLKNELDSTLKEIKSEVSQNGISIARLQSQVEGVLLRFQ